MTARFIAGLLALAGVSACGIAAGLANFEMMDKVNNNLPESQQFSALGWYSSKVQRLYREYRRLYPEGRLLYRVRVLQALMAAGLLICVGALGFFARPSHITLLP